MKMKSLFVALLSLSIGSFTLAADNTNNEIDSTQEVRYQCRIKIGEQNETVPLSAMYGIKDGKVVVAQLKYQDTILPSPSDAFERIHTDIDAITNTFMAENDNVYMSWTTVSAEADSIAKVDGGKLAYKEKSKTNAPFSIMIDNCKLAQSAGKK